MAVFRVDAVGAALKELEISGYLVCRQLWDARGRITDTEYTIYEQPHTPLPGTACPDTEKPDMDSTDTGTPAPTGRWSALPGMITRRRWSSPVF